MSASPRCSTRRPCISTRWRRSPRRHRAGHQRGLRGAERRNPRQRRGRLGRAVPSRISAARDRRDRAADRAAADRRRLFRGQRGDPTFADDLDTLDRDPSNKRLSWRYGISTNVLDKSCAPARSRTGSNCRCCRRAPNAGGAEWIIPGPPCGGDRRHRRLGTRRGRRAARGRRQLPRLLHA